MRVCIATGPFDVQVECAAFSAERQDAGALVSFVGTCRANTDGAAVCALDIQQYASFTSKEIVRIAQEIAARFSCPEILVVHRVGRILPGEAIVLVAALSAHRDNAFEVVRVLMDYLKTDAPLWKREVGPDGARWIEPRARDYERRSATDREMA